MAQLVLCCEETKISLLFPGMMGQLSKELKDFCEDLQKNPNIVHDRGAPGLPALSPKTLIMLCCSTSTSIVQVDKFIDDVKISSRYFMRDNAPDRGIGKFENKITEISAQGSVQMIQAHWEATLQGTPGPEQGRAIQSPIRTAALMKCDRLLHDNLHFQCLQMHRTSAMDEIMQELYHLEASQDMQG